MITGTPRKVVIDGITCDVPQDVNVSFVPTKWKNEAIPTSGRTLTKRTKQIRTKELVVVASPSELEVLAGKADSLASKTFSLEYADGTVYRGAGQMNIDKWESEEGKATVMLIPDNDWTVFASS